MLQTSENPIPHHEESRIPHPDTISLKKSSTLNGLIDRFIWLNERRPTQRATPQKPREEIGVEKSRTAQRPVESRRGLVAVQNSIESILNFKTNPNLEEAKVTLRGNVFPRVLRDQDKILHGKGESVSKKLSIPNKYWETFQREKKYRDLIPRPKRQEAAANFPGRKRTLDSSEETSRILGRKTLSYSEPTNRPSTGTHSGEKLYTDPRRLVSILGDPLPYKRSNIANQKARSVRSKRVQVSRKERKKKAHRKKHFKKPFLHSWRLESSDWNKQDMDEFYSQDFDSNYLDGELTRRDKSEHKMLERLLDDSSPSFGTRDEKLEEESTIKQIEDLSRQSTALSKEYDFTDLPSQFANMEVSEGDLPWYDQINDGGVNVRKSRVTRRKDKKLHHTRANLRSEKRFTQKRGKRENSARFVLRSYRYSRRNLKGNFPIKLKTRSSYHQATSLSLPRQRRDKRSFHHHRYYHHHLWPPSALQVRMFPYYDYPYAMDNSESGFIHFHRFPTLQRYPSLQRWPGSPMSSMAERFIPFPRVPKISEFSPDPLERLERLPPPTPIPPAIMDQEEAGTREDEPIDELTPLPEPIPEPEPPPIPELASIKEIPPISEPQEKAPDNLDPKKTFDTGESNGGVKKSTSRQ